MCVRHLLCSTAPLLVFKIYLFPNIVAPDNANTLTFPMREPPISELSRFAEEFSRDGLSGYCTISKRRIPRSEVVAVFPGDG
jgi:hypothetical protein